MKKIFDYILKHKYIILLILLYTFFFLQMQFVHFYGDDFEVLYPLHNRHTFLNVFNFCLDKMSYFWNEWSGRVVGHFIVSFGLSFFGIQFFRILNPIMIFVLVYLCLKILSLFKKFDFIKSLFFLSLIIIGFNVYISRETLYWAYGGILYVWGFNLTLLVVYFVYKHYLENKKISSILFILLSIICFIQTFVLEQLSFMLIAFLFIMIIGSIINKKNCGQLIFLFLVSLIGFLTSSFAPGNIIRTEPLVEELELYTDSQIFLGKTHAFFNFLFNPKLLGVYISIFALLINKKYLSTLNKGESILKKIPSIIVISYFFVILISKVFNINILKFYEDTDTLFLMYDNNSLSQTNHIIMSISMISIIIYYLLLNISIFYMTFKIFWKEQRFFVFSLIITYITNIITAVLIRFIGVRYYIFFLIPVILISLYCIFLDKKKAFNLTELLFISIVLPFKYAISVVIIIMVIMIIYKNFFKFLEKYANNITILLGLTILACNFFVTLSGYIRNDKIYKNNEQVLKNANEPGAIVVDAIPDYDKLYTWHSISMRWNDASSYYGFYLNRFYEPYYQIDMDNVYIRTEDGYYVQ